MGLLNGECGKIKSLLVHISQLGQKRVYLKADVLKSVSMKNNAKVFYLTQVQQYAHLENNFNHMKQQTFRLL